MVYHNITHSLFISEIFIDCRDGMSKLPEVETSEEDVEHMNDCFLILDPAAVHF
jgi:hypothetical protein